MISALGAGAALLIAVLFGLRSLEVVRDAAFRMESEGLISKVTVSTPRGLLIAQKRDGRR